MRNVSVNNAGGFQELAGARAVLALARAHGIRAATAEDAVAKATRTPGAGDHVPDTSSGAGWRSVSPPSSRSSIQSWWSSPAG